MVCVWELRNVHLAEGPCFEGFMMGLEVVEVQVGKGGGSHLIATE